MIEFYALVFVFGTVLCWWLDRRTHVRPNYGPMRPRDGMMWEGAPDTGVAGTGDTDDR